MEEQEKKELDLIDILRICFKYIRLMIIKIWDIFIWFIRFVFQSKWILLFAVVCGILFAFYWSRPENLRYKGESEMRFNIYDAYFYKNLVNQLDLYCKDENKSALSQALQITPEEAGALLSFNTYFFVDMLSNGTPSEVDYTNKFDTKDTVSSRMKDRLMLVVISKDTAVYSSLLGKIEGFFENNLVISEENAIRLKHIDEKIVALDNEIYLLDSLRKKEYFKKDAERHAKLDQTILLSEKEMRLYHSDILGLESLKQSLQWQKEIQPTCVRFLTPFRVDPTPVNNLKKSMVKLVILSFVFGLFVAFGWKYRIRIYRFLSHGEEKNEEV